MSRSPANPSAGIMVLRGRYEVGDLIGQGGSAEVRAAHDRLLDRPVAIKLLAVAAAESADPRAHERFVREARSSAGFTHRHAVATYDAGEDGGQLFIVMELVDGPSLASRIATDAPMAEPEIVRIGTQVLSALAAAHDAGLIHRDVKPANILLDRAGNVKLADFGIAKRFDEMADALTAEGMVIGTHDYLAPEQAAGAETGPAADIFALGVVLWEMATGWRPARGTDPDLRAVRPDVSDALATTIATALAPEPDDRFASAREMAASLSGAALPTQLSIVEPSRSSTATLPLTATTAPMTTAAREQPGTGPTVVATPSAPDQLAAHEFVPPRWWPVALVALVVVLIGAFAFAQRDDVVGEGGTAITEPPVTTAVAVPLGEVATTPAATAPPESESASMPAPATTAPAPPEAALPVGFNGTDDLDEFIDQLRNAGTGGPQSGKVADKLREISESDKNPGKLRKDIEGVNDEIDKWVNSGELDPAVAEEAKRFLTQLSP